MQNLSKLLKSTNSDKFLFLFPHFDDFTFVCSGLIQQLNALGIASYITVFYEKDNLIEMAEFEKSCKLLKVTKGTSIKTTHPNLKKNILAQINEIKPDFVVTFDPGGVTGNSHHTLVSLKTYETVKNIKQYAPKILWRVADREEEVYFGKMPNPFGSAYKTLYKLQLRTKNSLLKLRAIFANKSRIKGIIYKLRLIEWYLFDHSEMYYLVDLKKDLLNINFVK